RRRPSPRTPALHRAEADEATRPDRHDVSRPPRRPTPPGERSPVTDGAQVRAPSRTVRRRAARASPLGFREPRRAPVALPTRDRTGKHNTLYVSRGWGRGRDAARWRYTWIGSIGSLRRP